MTPRARKKPLLPMPAHTCQHQGCGQEYPSIGDFADTDRAALLGGWVYRAGQWSCPGHRDLIPWWPGPARPVLPVRVPGVTRRAEVIGVPVAAIENVPPSGQAGPEDDVAASGTGGDSTGHPYPDEEWTTQTYTLAAEPDTAGDLEPLPPLPQRIPAGPPDRRDEEQADAAALLAKWGAKPKDVAALADGEPLESLAPEPEEDET